MTNQASFADVQCYTSDQRTPSHWYNEDPGEEVKQNKILDQLSKAIKKKKKKIILQSLCDWDSSKTKTRKCTAGQISSVESTFGRWLY